MRDVAIAMEEVLVRGDDGRYWSPSGFSSEFWFRYERAFEAVFAIARVRNGNPPPSAAQVPEHITVVALPAYKGLVASMLFVPLLMLRFSFLSSGRLYFLRAPGVIAMSLGLVLSLRKVPYAVELVGDIDDVLRVLLPKQVHFLIRSLVLSIFRYVVRRARGVAYVTSSTLQLKYPCGVDALSASYSSVTIDYVAERRPPLSEHEFIRIISVGTFSKSYKGFDTIIRAVKSMVDRAIKVEAVIVGDGDLLSEYVALSESLGLSGLVVFTGRVSRDEVLKFMDVANVYISASRTEGLPRVIVEAMSRSLPVISTPVGGCGEIVLPDYLFPVDNVDLLVERVESLFGSDTAWLESMNYSRRVAHDFLRERVEGNRNAFMERL